MSAALATTAPAEYTVQQLVALALRQIGVGAQGTMASAADIADGVMHLNMLLGVWQRQRWMVPNLVDYPCVSTGNLSYVIGAGGDIVPAGSRPDELDSVYLRWLGNIGYTAAPSAFSGDFDGEFSSTPQSYTANQPQVGGPYAYDYPLQEIESREDYSAIRVKALATWPQCFYYSPDFPTGTLYLWPVPLFSQWEVHVVCKAALPANLTAASVINLAPEYQDAIMWLLAQRLAPSYGQAANDDVKQFARAAIQTIKGANTQIPALEMPAEILPRWGYGTPWWFGGGVGGASTGPTTAPPSSVGTTTAALSGFLFDTSTLDAGTFGTNPPEFGPDFDGEFYGASGVGTSTTGTSSTGTSSGGTSTGGTSTGGTSTGGTSTGGTSTGGTSTGGTSTPPSTPGTMTQFSASDFSTDFD